MWIVVERELRVAFVACDRVFECVLARRLIVCDLKDSRWGYAEEINRSDIGKRGMLYDRKVEVELSAAIVAEFQRRWELLQGRDS